jgi:hypothetical protein
MLQSKSLNPGKDSYRPVERMMWVLKSSYLDKDELSCFISCFKIISFSSCPIMITAFSEVYSIVYRTMITDQFSSTFVV